MIVDEKIYIEHFGKKGMKWGVRKGKSKTGISRVRSAQIERNTNTATLIKNARAGKSHKVLVSVGKKLVGEQKQKENWNRMLKDLNDQNKRIKSGKLTIEDKLNIFGQTNLFDLGISRQRKRL